MKYIVKNHPPKVLQDYRKTPNATYNGCPCGREWSQALLKEQGYICAFTMKRIKVGTMKRAHLKPRSKFPELQLDHSNVVGTCMGNEGKSLQDQYADTRQGNQELKYISPLNEDCERLIQYRDNGEIRVNDDILRKELIDDLSAMPKHYSVLNLNHDELINGRISAWKAAKKTLNKRCKNGEWKVRIIDDLIDEYKKRDEKGRYQEYCNFVLHRLQKERKWRVK